MNRAPLLALAALSLAAAPLFLAQAAHAQTTVNGTYSATDPNGYTDALDLTKTGNSSSGPSPTPAQAPGNAYLFTGGTYTAINTNALKTSGATVTINSGTFTGGFNSLYLGTSTVTVNGGTFTLTSPSSFNVQSYQTNLSVYGGTFNTPSSSLAFYIDPSSTDTFYGDFTPQTITGTSDLSGTFTGTLANGGPRQTFSYQISQGGILRLVNPNAPSTVPEPSSVAAFAFTGLGAAALMLRARKRQPAA